jgi:hypothetical protein
MTSGSGHTRGDDTRLLFFGVSAYVGRIDSATRCGFWPDDPRAFKFDPGCLVSVDLSLTPSAATAGKIQWSDVIVEDHGVTTIGPTWPQPDVKPSLYVGAVYLEAQFLAAMRRMHKLPVPPETYRAQPYELQTIVHQDGDRKGKRYRGFHAEVEHATGDKARVRVYVPGTVGMKPPEGPFDLDLGSDDVDPIGDIGGAGGAKSGSLFLNTTWLHLKPLDGPKLPIGQGF